MGSSAFPAALLFLKQLLPSFMKADGRRCAPGARHIDFTIRFHRDVGSPVIFHARAANHHAIRVIGPEDDMDKIERRGDCELAAHLRDASVAIQHFNLANPGEPVIVVTRIFQKTFFDLHIS